MKKRKLAILSSAVLAFTPVESNLLTVYAEDAEAEGFFSGDTLEETEVTGELGEPEESEESEEPQSGSVEETLPDDEFCAVIQDEPSKEAETQEPELFESEEQFVSADISEEEQGETEELFSSQKDNGLQQSVELYALMDNYDEYISIPSDYLQQYQISMPENASCQLISGDSVTVSANGLVEPAFTIFYWNNGIGSTASSGEPGERATKEYNWGTSIIEVQTDTEKWQISVTLKDYRLVYADQVYEDYIQENITGDMTEMEKLRKIAEFPCQYDYGAGCASGASMIVLGYGDCWASTDAIVTLCEKIGIPARVRDARQDPGAGSGHMNALAKVDGKFYVVEAGYVGNAPRHYSLYEQDEYAYKVKEDGTISITAYQGVGENIAIPGSIDGYTVSEVGEAAFYFMDDIQHITIPSSVKKIGDYAFDTIGACTVSVPEGVEEIGKSAFSYCIDYHGTGGSYGVTLDPEIIELPASIKKLGTSLKDSVVLYRGTKEQWNQIEHLDGYEAPQDGNLYCTNAGIAIQKKNVTLSVGKKAFVNIYDIDNAPLAVSGQPQYVAAEVKHEIRQEYFLRDGKRTPYTNAAATLTLTGKAVGTENILITTTNGKSVEVCVTVKECNHQWKSVTVNATCTSNGFTYKICKLCGKKQAGSEKSIPAAGHKTSLKNQKKATRTETGYTGDKICYVCGIVVEKGQEIPKITGTIKMISSTLPMQVKKAVSAKALIAEMENGDSIAALKTSNAKVAVVNNSTFKITAKKAGKATITVTLKSGVSANITVNVKKGKVAATRLTGIKKTVTLKKGKKLTLKPVLSPITCTEKVTYTSSNKKVATVSAKGVIKAKKKGKATIKVKAGKKVVTCKVTVK